MHKNKQTFHFHSLPAAKGHYMYIPVSYIYLHKPSLHLSTRPSYLNALVIFYSFRAQSSHITFRTCRGVSHVPLEGARSRRIPMLPFCYERERERERVKDEDQNETNIQYRLVMCKSKSWGSPSPPGHQGSHVGGM